MGRILSLGRALPRLRTILAIVAALFLATGAACSTSGACVSSGAITGQTYCRNGWTKAECSDYNNRGINGATWYFYKGQTCDDRGLAER